MFLLNYYACASYLMVMLFNFPLIVQALSPMQEEYETMSPFLKSHQKPQFQNYIYNSQGKQDLLIKSRVQQSNDIKRIKPSPKINYEQINFLPNFGYSNYLKVISIKLFSEDINIDNHFLMSLSLIHI